MATILCPECNNSVYDSLSICPNCGYPIKMYTRNCVIEDYKNKEKLKHQEEIDRLTQQINPIPFTCPAPRLKVCLKCGSPFFTGDIDKQNFDAPVCECGFPGVEIDYPQLGKRSALGDALYVLRHEVIPRNIGDKESDAYQKYTTNLYTRIQKSEQRQKSDGISDWKIKPIPPDQKDFGVSPEAIRYERQCSTVDNLKYARSENLRFLEKILIISVISALVGLLFFALSKHYYNSALSIWGIVFFVIAVAICIPVQRAREKETQMFDAKIQIAEEDIRKYDELIKGKVEAARRQSDFAPLLPHCPFCASTNLTKITVAKKSLKAVLFGTWGVLDDAGKTYKCNNCGGKF